MENMGKQIITKEAVLEWQNVEATFYYIRIELCTFLWNREQC